MIQSFLETPILNTLRKYLSCKPTRMHVPFHAGTANNNIFPKAIYNLDISEVSGYDIEGKDNPIFQSEKITADFFSVKHSFYLTGGASVGLLASLIALNKFGKKIILARNVHKSVINGVVLAGLEPIWLDVDFLDAWGVFSKVNPQKLADVVSSDSDIGGCVIVSPTYEGIVSDIGLVSKICHEKTIPLIVDEAHGSHLWFLSDLKNLSALKSGADVAIQSWHKSLGSLTQSGVLHLVNEKYFTYNDIKRSLDLVSSTSPSFLLLLSLELTRKHLQETKGRFFNDLLIKAKSLKLEMQELTALCLLENDDPFKIYLKHKNFSGIDFAYRLYKDFSIEIESANEIGLLMLVGKNFNTEIKNKIIFAIKEIIACRNAARNIPTTKKSKPWINKFKSNPREAFIEGFKKKNEKEYYCDVYAPCPPGYVLEIPGNKKCN